MKSLFNHFKILNRLAHEPTLYAFDFDGTLAPIVARPSRARMAPSHRRLVTKLAKLRPVAVVSGRGLKDLERRLKFQLDFCIGNHGLESVESRANELNRLARICAKWKEDLTLPEGVELEDKVYSLSLHYRLAPRPREAQALLKCAAQQLDPKPRVIAGYAILNLVPSGSINKGTALKKLADRLKVKHVLYFGDDETDEDVFALKDSRLIGVRIGRRPRSKAEFYIDNMDEMVPVLKAILDAVDSVAKRSRSRRSNSGSWRRR